MKNFRFLLSTFRFFNGSETQQKRGGRGVFPCALAVAIFFLCLGQAASARGGSGAAIPLAVDGIPSTVDVNYWYLFLGTVLAAVTIWNSVKPSPPLHKEFANKEETNKKLDKIEHGQQEILEALARSNSSQYDARRRMHAKINAQENALNYLAGTLDKAGDPTGRRIREIMKKPDQEDAE
jgi:hypothetical protein